MGDRMVNSAVRGARHRSSRVVSLILGVLLTSAMAACGNSNNSSSTNPPPPVTFPQACSGQSLIAIDSVHNVGYVAIYQLDATGNAQLAVIDLTVGAANALIKTISLTGSVQPVSQVYNPLGPSILAEARDTSNQVHIYQIDPNTQSVTGSIVATGLTHTGMSGGIVENFLNNSAIVAGTSDLGILDTSTSPPTWNQVSILDLSDMQITIDSMALNSSTDLLFISNLGNNIVVDADVLPLSPIMFQIDPNESLSNGIAFDVGTNILLQSQMNGSDSSYGFNFRNVNLTASPAFATNVYVGGLGFEAPVGLGPGGLAIVNCVTHQGLVADIFGQNFKLLQLPKKPVKGGLDNSGQPGTGTRPNSSSVYTIAASILPKGNVGGTPTQLVVVNDPSSLAIDPKRNLAYMLADTSTMPHMWVPGDPTPLFLVRVDLSDPVFGGSPTGGPDGNTFWNPASAAIPLP